MNGSLISAITEAYREACSLHGCKVDYQWLTTALLVDYELEVLNRELRNFNEYWSDQPKGKRHKSVKRTIRNWMSRAVADRKSLVEELIADVEPYINAGRKRAVELVDLEEAKSKWADWLNEPSRPIDPHTYKTWYAASRAVGFDKADATLVVELPNEISRQWLEDAQDQPDFKVRYQAADVSDH